MKKDIHPKYQEVLFKDMSTGETFKIHSTLQSKKTEALEGTEYPLVELEISSSSHPFYTGQQKLIDTGGRIDRFRKRFNIKD